MEGQLLIGGILEVSVNESHQVTARCSDVNDGAPQVVQLDSEFDAAQVMSEFCRDFDGESELLREHFPDFMP